MALSVDVLCFLSHNLCSRHLLKQEKHALNEELTYQASCKPGLRAVLIRLKPLIISFNTTL